MFIRLAPDVEITLKSAKSKKKIWNKEQVATNNMDQWQTNEKIIRILLKLDFDQ